MPYSAAHKADTRQRIVTSARRLFNRHGFERVTIEQIMADAALTRGGFYNHFTSKEQLFAEAVASYHTCNPFAADAKALGDHAGDPGRLARMLVDLYLSDRVFDNVDDHCPLYALPSDVSRAGLSPRMAYTDLLRSMVFIFHQALRDRADAGQQAQAIVALCVGGMVLARTTDDPDLRGTLRGAAHAQAVAMLER